MTRAPKYRAVVIVERDGETLYRIPVDPLCLHLTANIDQGRRAHIVHAKDCSCGGWLGASWRPVIDGEVQS